MKNTDNKSRNKLYQKYILIQLLILIDKKLSKCYNWYYQFKWGNIMKYIKQFGIILAISFIGEILNYCIPLPIPASIYGLVIMFLCLHFKLFHVDDVKTTAVFLIEIMPLMFIPAAVGLITSWNLIQSNILAYIVVTIISTIAVMTVSGWITQIIIRYGRKKEKKQ